VIFLRLEANTPLLQKPLITVLAIRLVSDYGNRKFLKYRMGLPAQSQNLLSFNTLITHFSSILREEDCILLFLKLPESSYLIVYVTLLQNAPKTLDLY